MNAIIITHEQIEEAGQEKVICTTWGFEVYSKVNGDWQKEHILVREESTRSTHKIYMDGRPSEVIKWGNR